MRPWKAIYDLSPELSAHTPVFPGDPPFARSLFLEHRRDGCEAATLTLSAHTGAHLDFPSHVRVGGARSDDYPVASFILPAVVLDVRVPDGPGEIAPESLDQVSLESGSAVLFKTWNSRSGLSGSPGWAGDCVTLGIATAQRLATNTIALVGIDALSIEPVSATDLPVHRLLLGRGILLLEGLVLRAVPAGSYTLLCLPLRIAGAEAAPVRAVLLEEVDANSP